MRGFLRLLHGFLHSCMHSSHFIALGTDSYIILVSGTFAPNPAASDSPMHPGTHSCHVSRRTGPGDALPSKSERSLRAGQASPMVTPACHTVFFSNSPRNYTQAFSLRHQMAGGQIK